MAQALGRGSSHVSWGHTVTSLYAISPFSWNTDVGGTGPAQDNDSLGPMDQDSTELLGSRVRWAHLAEEEIVDIGDIGPEELDLMESS